jgi:hypothetical protein
VAEDTNVQMKDTVPLWLAVAITVCVSLPFGIWLGDYNLPIWASFIVWAEYFALGAKAKSLLTIVPAYIAGVIVAEVIMTSWVLINQNTTPSTVVFNIGDWAMTYADIALFGVCFVGFSVFVYAMKYWKTLQTGSLPYFNGISMGLAVFFTGAFLKPFGADLDPNLVPAAAGVGAILAGVLGAFLGWFNVTITFPRPVRHAEGEEDKAVAA